MTISRLRSNLTRGVDPRAVAVGGVTAGGLDIVDRLHERTPLVVALALTLSTLLLVIAFRSIWVPLKAAITTLLSVGAALGIVSFLYGALGFGGTQEISYFVPLFLFAIVFGLSTDYEVFLLSRIRDEYLAGAATHDSIWRGVVTSNRSITLAGLVMIAVFLAQSTSAMEPLKQLGLGMAIAVLLDVTIIRTLIVPATMALLGERNWWFPGARRYRAVRVPSKVGARGWQWRKGPRRKESTSATSDAAVS